MVMMTSYNPFRSVAPSSKSQVITAKGDMSLGWLHRTETNIYFRLELFLLLLKPNQYLIILRVEILAGSLLALRESLLCFISF